MTDLPRHPEANNEGASHGYRPQANRPRWSYALMALVVALIVLMVVLHLTGVVGPGSH